MGTENQKLVPKAAYRPPFLVRILFDFMLEKVNIGQEHGLKMTIVVENFRALYYLGFVSVLLIGYILTANFVTEDHTAIIQDVFGVINLCVYVDFPPATYVAPIVYIFPMLSMIVYNVISIFRINISYGARKLTYLARNWLVSSHVYSIISVIWFLSIFEVQPDRKKPATMIFHSMPYINLKIALAVIQISVVWFGTIIAWKDIEVDWIGRKAFFVLNWIHAILLIVTCTIGCIFAINGIGDMGTEGLVGKGLWWNVHKVPQFITIVSRVFANKSPLGDISMALIIPFFQSMVYIKSKSFKNLSKTHTVMFYITDNKTMDE